MLSGCSAPANEPAGEEGESEQLTANPQEEESLPFTEFANLILLFGDDEKGMSRLITNNDGTFSGRYTLFETDDLGDEHLDGIQYLNTFTGVFSAPVKKAEGIYSVIIEQLDLDEKVGNEINVAGVLYRNCEPYGLAQGDEILIYPPKTPIANLPKAYQTWGLASFEFPENELSVYGFYHAKEDRGFFVQEKNSFDLEIESLDKKEEELYKEMNRGRLTQGDMNATAAENYYNWDGELNKVWEELERKMNEGQMNLLRKEESQWISFRDAVVEKSGKQAEGGSMQPCLEYTTASELTKNRIKDLLMFLYEIARKDSYRKPLTYHE